MASLLSLTESTLVNLGLNVVISTGLLLGGIYVFTQLKCWYDLYEYDRGDKTGILRPPQIPYALPWLGNSLAFAVKEPQKFWKQLFSWYPQAVGACTIVLGGQNTNVLFNRYAVSYLMKDRDLGREIFNIDAVNKGFGLTLEESQLYYEANVVRGVKDKDRPDHPEGQKVSVEYLLRSDRVNELTAKFLEVFRELLIENPLPREPINMYSWARTLMFRSSITALMGSRLLEVFPDFEAHFYQFDSDVQAMFFSTPKWMMPGAFVNRDKVLDTLVKWHDVVISETNDTIADPDTVAWDPYYGSRITRKRQQYYREIGLERKLAWAGLDLGLMFAIASNAVPATGWMLMHILQSVSNPPQSPEESLYTHVTSEIITARNEDGTFDISKLCALPIFNSTFSETLRLYADTLINRMLPYDLTLPLSDPKSTKQRSIAMKKGDIIMAPSWPAHHDHQTWTEQFPHLPPPDQFYPYRFLTKHPDDKEVEGDKMEFTTTHATGMYFPFGGGKTMCPGRTFAKQEIMAAVAIILCEFDLKPLGYVDENGNESKEFPIVKDCMPGTAIMAPKGDVKVSVKQRNK
ncbi:hypothetical protein BT93_L4499 [Corymbia citriodora subsp. variegata]|uniref:Cytochrome P450 n=1 Tax=Corymbia citriodora subsp. variegata TaxID=360336 RepID=A0A8T0CHX4_CORYI|nr:hypothetical protein BT93_L4499 [Corymbia citriodora subsp. variegata]